MKKIKQLATHIKGQLKDAEEYADLALYYHDDDKALADLYFQLAKEELHHKDMEHDHVVRIIRAYDSDSSDTVRVMKAIWEWQHEQMLECEAEIRQRMAMYK